MKMITVTFSSIRHLVPNRNFDFGDNEVLRVTNFKGYNYQYTNELTWIRDWDSDLCSGLSSGVFILDEKHRLETLQKDIKLIFSSNPRLLFAKILKSIKYAQMSSLNEEIYNRNEKNSFISKTALIGDNCIIGHGVVIGHNTTILEGTEIGDNVLIGNNCCIGGEGFGYVFDDTLEEYLHLEHFGGVLIENNVEIGNGVCVDKAVFGYTTISSGVKIDNLSQIAHNSFIGKNTLIMANVTISGSCVIGMSCWISPSVAISNKITVGDNTKVGIGSVVTKNLRSDSFYLGYPVKRIG